LNAGERRTLVLEGRGSAGFGWFATVDDPAVASVASDGTVERAGHQPGTSGGRDEVLVVTGIAPGETFMRCTLTRPWDHKQSIARREYRIVVT